MSITHGSPTTSSARAMGQDALDQSDRSGTRVPPHTCFKQVYGGIVLPVDLLHESQEAGMAPQTVSEPVSIVAHTVNRLVVRSSGTYDELRARYEAAVPAFDRSLLDGVTSWDEVLTRTAAAATN